MTAADVAADVAVRFTRPIGLLGFSKPADATGGLLTGRTKYVGMKPEDGGPRPVAEVRIPSIRTIWVLLDEMEVAT